jgi:ankyrin repeat protein
MRNTPLHIAAKHGHFLIVKYLLENGATVLNGNKEAHTAYDFTK